MAARTIDNLGIDASTRYAVDQDSLNKDIITSSVVVPKQAEIDVTSPSFSSEFDLLFDTANKNPSWAQFSTPDKYKEQRKSLFTKQQIIPSLGTPEKLESLENKLLHAFESKEHENVTSSLSDWEQDIEKKDQSDEQKVLLQFLKTLHTLDRCLSDISARRIQYQKG